MAHVTRTATIQARVVPAIKEASERVLWRIGLNMSEAMELFLRRIIVEERIPFDVAALDLTQATSLLIKEGGPEREGPARHATGLAGTQGHHRKRT